jgi:hypothetical protein
MDSRSKILSAETAADRFPDALWVLCHLDPLTADHVRRLAELAAQPRPLVVAVADPPDPLLPLASRAELAASLRCVAAVVAGPPPEGAAVIDERARDLERRDALTTHVHRRHSA